MVDVDAGPSVSEESSSHPPDDSQATVDLKLPLGSQPPNVLKALCEIWFEKYHVWMPILHQLTYSGALDDFEALTASPNAIVVKAISTITVADLLPPTTSKNEQTQWVHDLHWQVIMQATESISMQSLQALLILTILDYGGGHMSGFWLLVALCKR